MRLAETVGYGSGIQALPEALAEGFGGMGAEGSDIVQHQPAAELSGHAAHDQAQKKETLFRAAAHRQQGFSRPSGQGRFPGGLETLPLRAVQSRAEEAAHGKTVRAERRRQFRTGEKHALFHVQNYQRTGKKAEQFLRAGMRAAQRRHSHQPSRKRA